MIIVSNCYVICNCCIQKIFQMDHGLVMKIIRSNECVFLFLQGRHLLYLIEMTFDLVFWHADPP